MSDATPSELVQDVRDAFHLTPTDEELFDAEAALQQLESRFTAYTSLGTPEFFAALVAEHEAVLEGYGEEDADPGCDCLSCRIIRLCDAAEEARGR